MSLTITSWNMQGAGYEKLNAMCNVYADFKDTNVLLLQETGNRNNPNGIQQGESYTICQKTFKCVAVCDDETAKYKRCTTAILIDEAIMGKFRQCYTYGETGLRPAIFAIFDDIAVGTIHAPAVAGGDLVYLKYILNRCINEWEKQRLLPWVFMGDMNVDLSKSFPFTLCDGGTYPRNDYPNEIWIEKTSRTDVRCLIMYPKENTQGPNGDRTRKLDFAFLSDGLKKYPIDGVFNKMVLKSITDKEYLSDHNMIRITIGPF